MWIFCLELHERLMGSMSAVWNRHSENKPLNCPSRTALPSDYCALCGVFELQGVLSRVWEGWFECVTYTRTALSESWVALVPMFWPAALLLTLSPSVLWYLEKFSSVSLHLPNMWPLTRPMIPSPPLGPHWGLFPVEPWPLRPWSVTYHPPGSSACVTQSSSVWPAPAKKMEDAMNGRKSRGRSQKFHSVWESSVSTEEGGVVVVVVVTSDKDKEWGLNMIL